MKSTVKLFLVVCLFSSVAFADGELPNGNKSCPNGATTCFASSPTTTTTPTGDGKTTEDGSQTTADDSVLTVIQEYMDSMVGYFLS
jgi:hypothetical protein